MFEQLGFIYQPSGDMAVDVEFYTRVLGAQSSSSPLSGSERGWP
jgi:hypothetical protein